jgi:XisI protein
MAKLTKYRQIIQKILTEYRDWAAGSNQIGVQECVPFDEERDIRNYFPAFWEHHTRIAEIALS